TFTLNRFYSLHFILPFLVALIVVIHIIFLHSSGSSNPIGLPLNIDKISFFNYFVIKDIVTVVIIITALFFFRLYEPYLLMDHENFITANPIVTPPHIQPE
ncbi:cytochrome b N-terminal domain-containing protein, partial [Pseudomonas aeruginosa]|uniref:cytochrome b N-terminal domain-containing protein n=1 Tax=Pseudomonas aeruginosa TaxID=287 RepID=UPI00389254CE